MNSDRASELLAEVFRETILISHSLPHQVDWATEPVLAKVAYKYLCYRDALLWRSEEIAKSTRNELLENRIVSATILTRALFECAACFNYLTEKIQNAIETKQADGLDETAMRLLMGSKWQDWDPQPLNVLTMINRLDRKYEGARRLYDDLSEIAHPNWSGTAGAFSELNHETGITEFLRYRNDGGGIFERCLLALATALPTISISYNSCSDTFLEFNLLCTEKFETNIKDD